MQRSQSDVQLEIKGLILLGVLLLLVWLSVAIYQKAFVSTVDISVETQRAGLQLNPHADVRMRGALVGRVVDVRQENGRAVLTLSLDKDQAERVPADVEARILPTTLFGQKYVQLVVPQHSTAGPIRAGAVVPEDRSAAAVEIMQAFDNLQPLLTAVPPQDLSSTLQAMAQGLEGRGEQLGETVEATVRLLRDFRSHLPLLIEDLRLLASVSDIYGASMDDVLTVLENVSFSGRTVAELEDELAEFVGDVTTLSETMKAFLDRDGDGIVELNRTTEPILRTLARYAPSFPCLLDGLVLANSEFNSAFRNGKLHSYSVLGLQYPGYEEPDAPEFGAPPGPSCAGMPGADGQPHVVMPRFDDGGRYADGKAVVP
ncbi:MCE family protein [Nocardioides limicola]|uniref:MCE family protein n=1 Tax=Nocardioides limicola TaxID=2803368 RepID=UPI00193C12D1|nr:MCE family protein [Nocardioides sp. DJM-14]